MTLGHIVATTNVRLNLKKMCGKEDEFDPEILLQKKGIEMVKELQASYDVSKDIFFFHFLLKR